MEQEFDISVEIDDSRSVLSYRLEDHGCPSDEKGKENSSLGQQ
jgi:hypothetical protein